MITARLATQRCSNAIPTQNPNPHSVSQAHAAKSNPGFTSAEGTSGKNPSGDAPRGDPTEAHGEAFMSLRVTLG